MDRRRWRVIGRSARTRSHSFGTRSPISSLRCSRWERAAGDVRPKRSIYGHVDTNFTAIAGDSLDRSDHAAFNDVRPDGSRALLRLQSVGGEPPAGALYDHPV